jgi:hypothetical protein
MGNVEDGKQKAQEQTDEKVFLAFVWAVSRRVSEVMPEEPTFELAALMT